MYNKDDTLSPGEHVLSWEDGRFHRDFFKRVEMERQEGLLKLILKVHYD